MADLLSLYENTPTKEEKMKICDTKEPLTMKTEMLSRGWDLLSLDCGDFRFLDGLNQTVGIERKALSQLLVDMHSGQLCKQLDKLRYAVDIPILLAEGYWRVGNDGKLLDSNYTWDDVWDQLQTIQDEFGIRLQLTHDIQHTASRVDRLQKYYQKEAHLSAHRKGSSDLGVVTLCSIKNIGPKTAKSLLDYFGCLGNIALSTPDKFKHVEGIGEKTSTDIFNFWWTRKGG